MKQVLRTDIFLSGAMLEYVLSLLPPTRYYKRQFHIICGCNSMAHANRICAAYGLGSKVFTKAYSSVTGNQLELNLALNGGVFIEYDVNEYISLDTILQNIQQQIK